MDLTVANSSAVRPGYAHRRDGGVSVGQRDRGAGDDGAAGIADGA